MKKTNKKKVNDIGAKIFMLILHLKEETNKEYSFAECEKNIAYVFSNYDEFKYYFIQNGFDNISDDLLRLCVLKTTKKGTIITLKALCDHTIKTYKMNRQLTQEEIDEIHSKGKITPSEKVEEWESFGLCAPGNAIGSAKDRCSVFANCHDCLVEFASSYKEFDKTELQLVNVEKTSPLALKKIKK